jgi:alpha-L-fucosidase 2
LRDGNRADRCLANLVALQTCPNLFSKCFRAPQMDGSFGATAAVAEILLQSQHGTIHLLPALPKGWGEGEFIGLRARGGFTVDAAWKNGLLMSATVHSTLGGRCVVRAACPIVVKGTTSEAVQAPPGEHVIRFDTVRGGTYTIRPQD